MPAARGAAARCCAGDRRRLRGAGGGDDEPGRRRPLAAAGRAGEARRALAAAGEAGEGPRPCRRRPRQPPARRQPSPRRSPLRKRRRRSRRRPPRRRRQGRRRQPPLPDGDRRGQAGRADGDRRGAPCRRRHRGAGADRPGCGLPERRHGLRGRLSAERSRRAAASFGVDGSGVTVGILSDSFDRATTAANRPGPDRHPRPAKTCSTATCRGQATPAGTPRPSTSSTTPPAKAPTRVGRWPRSSTTSPPAPSIDFRHRLLTGETGFAANIEQSANRPRRRAGAKVIADDVGYFEEPFFQDGPVAAAVDEVTAAGVSYFSAAGNDNLIDVGRSRHRLLGSAGVPRFRQLPAGAGRTLRRNRRRTNVAARTGGPTSGCMHGLQARRGHRPNLRDHRRSRRGALRIDLQWAEPWNGVGDRPRCLLAKENAEIAEVDPTANTFAASTKTIRRTARRGRLSSSSGKTPKDDRRRRSPARDQPLQQVGVPNFDKWSPCWRTVGGVTDTEYPESSARRLVGPTVFGHAGSPRRHQRRRGPLTPATPPHPSTSPREARSSTTSDQSRARPPRDGLPSAETSAKARPRRHRLR